MIPKAVSSGNAFGIGVAEEGSGVESSWKLFNGVSVDRHKHKRKPSTNSHSTLDVGHRGPP